MKVLKRLPDELQERNVGLVILDSVAMLMRLEYDSRQVAARQQSLAEQASLLKQAAERFAIPVVVTNQITGGADGSGGGDQQRAALGVVWAHAVNTRLILDQQDRVRRVRVRARLERCALLVLKCGAYVLSTHIPAWKNMRSVRFSSRPASRRAMRVYRADRKVSRGSKRRGGLYNRALRSGAGHRGAAADACQQHLGREHLDRAHDSAGLYVLRFHDNTSPEASAKVVVQQGKELANKQVRSAPWQE